MRIVLSPANCKSNRKLVFFLIVPFAQRASLRKAFLSVTKSTADQSKGPSLLNSASLFTDDEREEDLSRHPIPVLVAYVESTICVNAVWQL